MTILSNQIKCNMCGDTPYSSHRHDMSYCKCGEVAVDGGPVYIRIVGKPENYTSMSIYLEPDVVNKCRQAITESVVANKNALGILCAIARTLRDVGYEIKKKEVGK